MTSLQNAKDRIAQIGNMNYEIEEMIRLGFITDEAMAEKFTQQIKKLDEAQQKLTALDHEIQELSDVDAHIEEIRKRRIERVKAERSFRNKLKIVERGLNARRQKLRRVNEPTYFGRGVSWAVKFEGSQTDQLQCHSLPELETFRDVAALLEVEPATLIWLIFHRNVARNNHYIRFEIPKRNGGTRILSSPKPALRGVQAIVQERILAQITPHEAATAFRTGLSIVDNAKQHADSAVIVKMDLKDFFPSVTFTQVLRYFESLGYNAGVATVLALITTEAQRVEANIDGKNYFVAQGPRSLPQGACTSPALANLVAERLDRRLTGLALASGWAYTRYADDLVFSTNDDKATAHKMVSTVTSICEDSGFTVNTSKTRIMRSPNRQTVTGLLVNDGVKLTRKDARKIRAFMHRCRTKGIDTVSAELGKSALHVARGYHAYMHMVSPEAAQKLLAENPWIKDGSS